MYQGRESAGVKRPRTVAAVTVATALLGTGLAAAPGAQAAPNAWSQLSAGARISNIAKPAVARAGSQLRVVWNEESAAGVAMRTRTISAAGVTNSGVSTVVTGWSTLTKNPSVVMSNGKPVVVFAGLRAGWVGQLTSATTSDGVNWTVGETPLAQRTTAYAGYGNDAVDDNGTLVVASAGNAVQSLAVNRGAAGIDTELPFGGCCGYEAALGRDALTGRIWAAWYSNASADALAGVQVQSVLPTLGARTQAPGSVTAGGSKNPRQRVPLVSRSGGGVWTAYLQGYPRATSIRLWQVGTTKSLTIPNSGNASLVTLSAAPGGRLWAAWYDATSGTIRAVRSNPAVTAFGAQRVIKAPARPGGGTTVWTMVGNGARGPLDIVTTATTGSGTNKLQLWHQQVAPALTVKAAPGTVRSSRPASITVTVTDAGAAVPGATVTVLGRVYRTNSRGVAVVQVLPRTRVGAYRLTAARAGYYPAATVIRVS